MSTHKSFVESGKRVLNIEKKAIEELMPNIDEYFDRACQLMLHCKGRVVVTGMGKSGHIGNKIASTLASTGTPAFFVHPGEASHGDLGMITSNDIVLAISNSGNTNEIITILPLIKRMNAPLISMTGDTQSRLAKAANVNLNVSVGEEACPLGLAPTSSTTATLVMGDALAVALLEARGFTAEDFALSHPGGTLGRKLLLLVSDVMHSENQIPMVNENTSVSDALLEMTQKGLGMTSIVDAQKALIGIYTDGDLRRTLNQGLDVHVTLIKDVMSSNASTVKANTLAAEAVKIMEDNKINGLMVVDSNNHPIGALNMQDLLRAGVV
ncbi:MAG: KpsF/GutQ family sugar-phosphate isomerase [Pseudomonadales bacterium]|nr:KpsF/GutQ family sugar-phosphate isomerase [Pseudomonadales bacterium]